MGKSGLTRRDSVLDQKFAIYLDFCDAEGESSDRKLRMNMSEIQPFGPDGSAETDAGPKGGLTLSEASRGSSEYWHFDALSDDGRDVVMIRFHANYPFSARYFKRKETRRGLPGTHEPRFPALSFTYKSEGTQTLHAVCEFEDGEFTLSNNGEHCLLGKSSFQIEAAEYGSGYMLAIDIATSAKRTIKAEFEWLSIDTAPSERMFDPGSGSAWSISAPRADVSGRITVAGRYGEVQRIVHFRGTGYHDHIMNSDGNDRASGQRCWGRAHLADSTVVFQRFADYEAAGGASSDLFLIQNGSPLKYEASYDARNHVRDRSGLKIPRVLTLHTDDGVELLVKPLNVIHSGFFEVQMLSDMTLRLPDGRSGHVTGLTEFVDPGRMKNPFLRWFSDLRVGKKGRPPLF